MTSLSLGPRISLARGSTSASGDCAQVVSRPDGETLCFLGDVTGHDPIAARLAATLGLWVREMASWMKPGALLTNLNTVIESTWPSDRLVSAICFLFDPQIGCGSLALAGQHPPVIKRGWSATPLAMKADPALGFHARQTYQERAFFLEASDVLIATTDGITDPLATAQDVLGLSALNKLIASVEPGIDDVGAPLLRTIRPLGLRDDATVLAAAIACTVSPDDARGQHGLLSFHRNKPRLVQ